ncbi:glycoside hydrolase family 95 protein [Niabella aquatica]
MRKVSLLYRRAIILISGILLVLPAFSQNLKLWYKQPATKWVEALPIGNGRIGAMIFGGVASDRIQFNEETLWTGEPRQYSRPGAYRYLDSIRQLLFAGKQKAAEALAEEHFMGLKSKAEDNTAWINAVTKGKQYASADFNDNDWKTMKVPGWDGWETVGFEGLDGAVWLRTSFILPDNWKEQNIVADFNRIRDYDYTYVNGVLVGSQQNAEGRKYTVPKNVLKKGKNTIAILVLNFANKGGIYGYKDTTVHIGVYPVNDPAAKISLNGYWKYHVVNDNPPPAGVYQDSYQPFGDLHLQFPEILGYINYTRELDISKAVASISYTLKGVNYKREYFVSAPNQALVAHLTTTKKGSLSFKAIVSSPHRDYTVTKLNNHTVMLSVKVRTGVLKGVSHLQAVIKGGKLTADKGALVIANADEATLYLTAATSYKNFSDVSASPAQVSAKALQALQDQTYESLKAAHISEYKKWFNTFFISLGEDSRAAIPTDERLSRFSDGKDPAFAALYLQYGRYLLISSSRPGTKPANLQGIWNDLVDPPWGSKYTTNINAEMNYWPAELLNLSPMHQPLFDMIRDLAITGRQTAKDHYNAPGWVLHHNTDLWRGTAPINAANHGIWPTGGAWLATHLWEHYRFTQDKKFLKDTAYVIMKEAALFFDHCLVKDPKTGYLISTPSNSPEQGGLVAGPTMDHQIIRALFKSVIEAGTILNIDADLRKRLSGKYAQIAPNRIGKYGQLQEWMQDIDDPNNKHRHISHLWGMYPGNEINYDETPALMNAAKQSLIFRGDEATGWSLGWKINCWARFKDAEHAFHMVQMLLRPVINGSGSYPNLFDAHPPFQIDGNFGGAAGIGEMLIQSHTGFIDIFPALPVAFANGEVKGIKARGGFELNFKWSAGKLQSMSVKSLAGQPLKIRYNGQTVNIATQKNRTYHFNGSLQEL